MRLKNSLRSSKANKRVSPRSSKNPGYARISAHVMDALFQVSRAACVLIALTAATVDAAEPVYPAKPIRMISPYAAGGGSDTLARILGQKLYETWGQPVV